MRQSSGRRAALTYRTGVALLGFARLPRAFTVTVTGGWGAGRRMPATFSVVVGGYVSGTVVDVNPVSTLITDDLAAHRESGRSISVARARTEIYRLLDIPVSEDQRDLRYSPRYFDGASYLSAARRAGGIGALERTLVAQARRGAHHRFLAAQIKREPRLVGPVASAAALPAAAALVSQAFKFLATQAASSLAGVAAEKAGTTALGWLLAAFGLDDVLKDQDVAEIRRIVDQLSKQVAQLQEQVGQLQRDLGVVGFSTLLHQTDRTIGQIDHATSQLELLAGLRADNPNRAEFARTIVDYIGTNLLDAPAILNRGLGSHLPLADNVIKAASRALGQRKFFGPQSSAEVRSVYDYFAAYQVQLAMLLQEYYHAKPTVYSAETNAANLARLQGNVESQARALKPDVPANTVIDTKSREMWVTDLPDPKKRLIELAEVLPRPGSVPRFSWRTGENVNQCGTRPVDGPTGVRGFAYCNWELPTAEAYRRLTEGWNGKSPASWLVSVAGFNAGFIAASGHVKWVRMGYDIGLGRFSLDLSVYQFDLSNDSLFSHRLVWRSPNWQGEFERVYAALMYVRKLAPDDSYWWSS
ncbi:MAG: hypothetical protein JO039_23030 [Solirubrobacterales bacterium]|nr:hypothetical protein [Solirubrobacterales bacterium]